MKTFLKDTILFLVSFMVIFVIAEIGFRIYTNYAVMYDIEMHKYAKKLKRESSVRGLSHEHVPNSKAVLMGVKVEINNMGFRDDFLPETKDPNEYRILVVGSSITMGWGVPNDSLFTTLLETELNKTKGAKKYNVINSGIGNYNALLESIYLKRIAPVVKPDKVILHYYINDVEYISPKKANWLIRNSYVIACLYVKVKETLFAKASKYSSIGEYYLDLYKDSNEGWITAQEAIRDMKDYCKSLNIKFLVLVQPDLHDFSSDSGQKKCHEKIDAFLKKNDIEYLDLFSAFKDGVDGNPQKVWVSRDDPHPNSQGHRIIYQALYDHIKNRM
ncbi:MAG: GDSL-type esterase/lipase family protein [Candidatus Omnitrophica bacterium]|nr:GDSL-type esterase/lipase family protein [Candidatus Omnitrophota bacterium]